MIHGRVSYHTQVCVSLPINDSFQNHHKTMPYQKFKYVDHKRACTLIYTDVYVSPKLTNFHALSGIDHFALVNTYMSV